MAGTTSRIVTYEEWLQMPESEGREELFQLHGGKLITMQGLIERQLHPLRFAQAVASVWPD